MDKTQNTRPPNAQPLHSAPQVLGKTLDGAMVVDRPTSHRHLPSALLWEAVGRIKAPEGEFAKICIPMGRIIGQSMCVETSDHDSIVFAQRRNRKGLTRFVLNRQPIDCSSVVIVLKRFAPDAFVLITAFIGEETEPEPWDHRADAQSLAFWQSHALIWNGKDLVPGTDTTAAPWYYPTATNK